MEKVEIAIDKHGCVSELEKAIYPIHNITRLKHLKLTTVAVVPIVAPADAVVAVVATAATVVVAPAIDDVAVPTAETAIDCATTTVLKF